MTRYRVVAACAAMLTALLLQGAVIAPFTVPVAVSLPAVLVAAVALCDGPGAGMALGFAGGLFADLASTHPAGVLALSWLGVGLICGLAPLRHGVRAQAATAAVVCAGCTAAACLLLAVIAGTGAGTVVRQFVPVLLGDALLALAVVPVVRALLGTAPLRIAPVGLGLAGRRG